MSARSARGMAAGQLALELPLELPAIALAPEWKDQQRLWGHPFHPMCSYLASFPAALTHAFIARYSRPGRRRPRPVLRAWHDAAPGLRRGPDRRRQRPQPVRAPAHRRQGRAGDARPGGDPAGAASARPGTRSRPAGWRSGQRVSADPGAPAALVPAAGSAADRDGGVESRPGRGRARLPSADARPAPVRPVRRSSSTIGRTGSWPPRSPGSSTARARATCRNSCRTPSRWRRAMCATSPPGPEFASPERDVFDGLAKKLDRLFRQPPPSIEGIALLGDARDVAPRARAALRAAGRPDRARLVVTSPPYLRVVKYGYYNWLRTWFLGFDSRAIDAALDDAHHREPYLAFLRDVLGRAPPGADRRRGRRPRDRRRARPTAGGRSGAGWASPNGSGRPPPSRRAIGWPASRSTTSRPTGR